MKFVPAILLVVSVSALALTCKQATQPPNGGPDTTSHNFIWRLDTLGDGSSSVLNDAFIITENNVIAVGEIFLRDSLGGFGEPGYGFARWDGTRWNLFRLSALGPTGVVSNLRPRGVFAFSATDIWFASGGVFRWNGQTVTPYWINQFPGNPNPIFDPGQTAEKLWGTSSSNLYAVGRQGAIAHFNGSTWQKLESGTTVDIQDIWGAVDARTGQTEILAVASNPFADHGSAILRINGSAVTAVPSTGLHWSLRELWFVPGRQYYVVGAGVHYKKMLDTSPWKVYPHGEVTSYHSSAIRGNAMNDVIVAGSFFEVVHFNGATWRSYNEELVVSNGFFGAVAIKGDLVVAVGGRGRHAVALMGRR